MVNQELEMYNLMAAIYHSNIPINFKGAMILHALLYENGYSKDAIRPTQDIDANWQSDDIPSMEYILKTLQRVIDDNNIDLTVKSYREYGIGKSAGFKFYNKSDNVMVFSMDMDVNRPNTGSRIYQVGDLKFRGIIVEQILADKISVLSSDKIFRRIKDFIDLYYLSHCVEINLEKVYEILENTNRKLSDFNGFINRKDELQHAFEKFRFTGDAEKPDFENAYNKVYNYVKVFFQK